MAVKTKDDYEKEFGRVISETEYDILKKIEETAEEDKKELCPCEYGICSECGR